MNQVTAILIGAGARGQIYARYAQEHPEELRIMAVAEPKADRRALMCRAYGIPADRAFSNWEDLLARPQMADAALICTLDDMHTEPTLAALKQGYHVLLEKPMSNSETECRAIAAAAEEAQRVLSVCHVLRYTPFYRTIKQLIDDGQVGEVASLSQVENVGYWHHAHSFVRGNWRNSQETSPMILQKSCHDMDILTWLLGKKCKAVSSFGSTRLFKPECAPEGAALRCLDGCKAKEKCLFDAEKIYITSPKTGLATGSSWMSSVLSVENTMESTYKALREGPYGRCVYHCDNDVVDHQQTNLLMEDGSTISFTMCAFTESCYRYFKAMGTQGEIEADMLSNIIHVREFGKEEETIDVGKLSSDLKGHGGGDSGIIQDFLEMLLNDAEPNERTTTLEHSMESHFIALAAEESRLHGGQVVDLEAFKQR